ncbi:FUSC family protein [Mycolicibacterium sp. HS_4_1]
MTDSDDFSSTRPISVAELLAKNGTIGAPPVGGRRRRRRGNSDAVTVAELTGEIPIIRPETLQAEPAQTADVAAPEPVAEPEPVPESPAEPEAAAADAAPAVEDEAPSAADEMEPDDTGAHYVVDDQMLHTDLVDPAPVATEAESDYEDHLRRRAAEADPLEFVAPSRKPAFRWSFKPVRGAEEMVPDPVDEDVPADADIDDDLLALKGAEPVTKLDSGALHVVDDTDTDAVAVAAAAEALDAAPVRDTSRGGRSERYDALFGGFAADEDTRREDVVADHGEAELVGHPEAEQEDEESGSALKRGAWVVGQSLLAVAFGAGMFFAFDQLWRWNQIVALMLSMLVILGLVAGIRVIRKDHDLASTLIAILVGGLVTFGPLALLYSA